MKKIVFISDPLTFTMGFIFFLVCELLSVSFIYFGCSGHTIEGMEIGMLILGAFFMCSVLIITIVCLPKWLSIIELNENEIVLRRPFKYVKKVPYKEYKYLQLGLYRQGKHNGLSYNRVFCVLSKKWLSQSDRVHINNIDNSEEIIKIKFSKKRYKKLYSILPNDLKFKLKQVVQESLTNYIE